MYEILQKMCQEVRKITDFVPDVALVLGSGLGDFVEHSGMKIETAIDYKEIEGFPVSTVCGHAGRLIFGYVQNTKVICMQGRVHYYEGYSMQQVVLPIRLMLLLGAKTLFLTNAAGGVNETFAPGDFMLITDHISCFVPSPLIGQNEDELGKRFPDMSEVYSHKLQKYVKEIAAREGILLREGVYVQLSGPQYESPAEIRMIRKLGADAVGMSTVCEAIAANHMGASVCAISLISNMACGIQKGVKLSHEEVQKTADAASCRMVRLMTSILGGMV